ncbi:DUF6728 family protein [Aridibaculum aurantiacum]|uniref:DUF6728 family protein n=1 Tax=Aridibaculum aurantiacum TaxID=2810307 RepID=UPI001A966909|nr:DUF6728 family protein [Aridibaculum aurantiacum]
MAEPVGGIAKVMVIGGYIYIVTLHFLSMQRYLLSRTFVTLLHILLNQYTMGIWQQIAEYLYIKKKDPEQPHTQWMKYMHGMNRISILVFLAAIIFMIVRFVILPLTR